MARVRKQREFRNRPLFTASDHGRPISLPFEVFSSSNERGWDSAADMFLRINENALRELNLGHTVSVTREGLTMQLIPGGKAGAVPLRSAHSGQVAGGVIIRPRFGWAGIGRVLDQTGWAAAPHFCELPMVPGSGREIPPWVLAGPVVARLKNLLANLARGYREVDEYLPKPRGRILWQEYAARLAKGAWQAVPCRFSISGPDRLLRSYARWTLERVETSLNLSSGGDLMSRALAADVVLLLETLQDIAPIRPQSTQWNRLEDANLRRGMEAMGWVRDERGLGGGREMDGLAWALDLDFLWEAYVEAKLRDEASLTGEELLTGRQRQTHFALEWHYGPRSLRQLVPDFIMRRGRQIRVIDAKYKAHFAELDQDGWFKMAEELRDAHRADIHQILAYAALFDAEQISAELVYPLRDETYEALAANGSDIAKATLTHGNRPIELKLRGIPFGARAAAGQREPSST